MKISLNITHIIIIQSFIGNVFYGELWGTLIQRDMEAWLLGNNTDEDSTHQPTIETPPLSEGETLLDLSTNERRQIYNVEDIMYV